MRIGYTPPNGSTQVTAVVLQAAPGGAWLTSDAGAACFDGKPARKSRMKWRTDAVPAIAHYVQVEATLAAATPIGICAFLGLTNVPVGTVVHVYGKRPADASVTWNFGGQNTATVVEFADGTRGAWFVLPDGAAAVQKVGFRIFNNAGGATWATAATTIDIGELVAMPAVDVDHEPSWDMPLIDPSSAGRSRGSQSYVARRTPYRRLQAALPPEYVNKVRAGGLANGMDWARLAYALAGQRRMAAIVRTLNQAETNATAIYGTAALSGERHASGDYYSASIVVEEEPAI